ncbi:TetR/AcrR family transcriptional regulator [Kutzneria sp. NPDC052558]|uniref:TetR/AcrR family transcriptional regulator n=1 Tax=Kutzneria sp. NPDC052558 TaxID=3364121 RepID=UPI0037C54CEB
MGDSESEPAPRGRPRTAEKDRAILAATCELLLARGYGRLSMEAVAVHSGVGKPTLYRRWPSKAALVADAVVTGLSVRAAPTAVSTPLDTGDIARDLHEWVDAYTSVTIDPHNAALIQALIAASAENPTEAESLYGHLTSARRQALAGRLGAAVAKGQVRADADLDMIAQTLIGSVVMQLLHGHADRAREHAHGLLDVVLRGLRPDG